MQDAGDALDDIPLVGDSARAPFDQAADASGALADAGRAEVEAVEGLAVLAAARGGADTDPGRRRVLPAGAVAVRPRGHRRPEFVDAEDDLHLFALRALANQPLHLLARVTDDPAGAWRRGRPGRRPTPSQGWRCVGRPAAAPVRVPDAAGVGRLHRMSDKKRTDLIVSVLDDAFAPLMKADPAAFRAKYRKMAVRPARVLPRHGLPVLRRRDRRPTTRSSTSDSGRIWVHGDLHVENFGTYLNSDGRLVFDVNDFDEAYLGRFTWDLQRFAASLALVGLAEGAARGRRTPR